MVFFVGDILMSARLMLIGILAVIDRLRKPHAKASPGFNPRVAVLIPGLQRRDGDRAHHSLGAELRLQESACHRDRRRLERPHRGSGARGLRAEIAAGRVQVLTKPNGGKAAALNYALDRLTKRFYVGIDADTVIAPTPSPS
jgi:hypothetical protein